MDKEFNYVEEANVTMSETFHTGVPARLIAAGLEKIAIEISRLDKVKKFMFYGRLDERLQEICKIAQVTYPEASGDIDFTTLFPNKTQEEAVRIFHGIIGIITEAGELAEALQNAIFENQPLDGVNVLEEVGDIQWYTAAILRATGTSFDEVQKTNISKLRARFPNKFTEFDANNRNLQAERAILERKPIEDLFLEFENELIAANSKPVVRVKDYALIGDRLVGVLFDEEGSGIRTSPILSHNKERGVVETQNTIYLLVGDPA